MPPQVSPHELQPAGPHLLLAGWLSARGLASLLSELLWAVPSQWRRESQRDDFFQGLSAQWRNEKRLADFQQKPHHAPPWATSRVRGKFHQQLSRPPRPFR
jgi:hypothetical protein